MMPISYLSQYVRLLCAISLIAGASACAQATMDLALAAHLVNIAPAPAIYGDDTRIFQGIPGIARTPEGRLWATWYSGGNDEGPDNYVMLASSDDDGKTWTPVRAVIDPEGPVRAYDPVLWTAPDGTLWWFYAQSYRWWDGRAGVWAVVCENPDAENPQWNTPRRLMDGIMMNKPTVLKNGDWALPVAIWEQEPKKGLPQEDRKYVPENQLHWSAENVGTHMYISKDAGKTFALAGTARFPNLQFDEHMIVERKDGTLWLWVRTIDGIGESFSRDGGKTWSQGKNAKIPHVNSRFFVRKLASGNLLLVKHNPPMDVAWLAPKSIYNRNQKRSHLTAYLSKDGGKTWEGGLLLDERLSVSYPDGDQAPDGRIFVIYDYNRKADKEILMASFTEEDILAQTLVDQHSHLKQLVNKATGSAEKAP